MDRAGDIGPRFFIGLGCWILAVIVIALFGYWSIRTSSSIPPGQWRLIARPPVPARAIRVKIDYPSNDVERYTMFETDLPAPAIQQFYRAELPKQGWRYRCTVTQVDPSCGSALNDDIELIDVYDRGAAGTPNWQTLEVRLGKPDAGGNRQVVVQEPLPVTSSVLWRSLAPAAQP